MSGLTRVHSTATGTQPTLQQTTMADDLRCCDPNQGMSSRCVTSRRAKSATPAGARRSSSAKEEADMTDI